MMPWRPAGAASREAGIDAQACAADALRERATLGTVLIADDDEDLRGVVRDLLAGDGWHVIEAASGTQVLEMLAGAADGLTSLPCVVLLDFVMPGLSGLGILGVMRRFPSMPPTIIMTGFPDRSVETFARQLGAVCVVRKPIEPGTLRALVRNFMPSSGGVVPRGDRSKNGGD